MRFGAAFGLLATASTVLGAPQLLSRRDEPKSFGISKDFPEDFDFFSGSSKDAGLGDIDIVDIDLKAKAGSKIRGDVKIGLDLADPENPLVTLDFSDVEFLIEHKVKATGKAALSFPCLEDILEDAFKLKDVDIDVFFALDLVVVIDSAIEVDCGFYVKLGKKAVLKLSLYTGELVGKSLDDIIAKGLPPKVIGGGGSISTSLRLRTKIRVRTVVDIPKVKPDLGVNYQLDAWISLCDYTAVFKKTEDCALQITEVTAVTISIAFSVDIDIGKIEDIDIVPKTTFTLSDTEAKSLCIGYEPEKPRNTKTAKPDGPKPTGKPDYEHDGTKTITKTKTETYTISACKDHKKNCGKGHGTKTVITKTKTEYEYECPTETSTTTKKPQPPTDCETLTPPKETYEPKPPKPCKKFNCGDDDEEEHHYGGNKPEKPSKPEGEKPEQPEKPSGNKPNKPEDDKPGKPTNGTKPDGKPPVKVSGAQNIVASVVPVVAAFAAAVFLF